MTYRAVLLGLIAAAVLSGVTYFNDFVLCQSHFVGSFLPISVFGGLVLFTLLINPLLGKMHKSLALRAPELAVIIALVFAACYVPGRGLMHYFTTVQMLPHWHERDRVLWKQDGGILHEVVPQEMLADPGQHNEALDGFLKGLGTEGHHIRPGDIPWWAWERSLSFWLPLLLSILLGMIGLSLILHRQWALHERLRYPIVTFAQSLLPEPGHAVSSVLRSRTFWIAAGAVICIHGANYCSAWYPRMLQIPIHVDFRGMGDRVPVFSRYGGGMDLLIVRIYFSAVGFAYLLSSDIALSVGIAPFVYTLVAGIFALGGVPLREGHIMSLSLEMFLHAGAYFAMFLVLIYIGRRYYREVMRRCFLLPAAEHVPTSAAWGARIFLAGSVLFILQLTWVGLDWQLAVLYTIGTTIIFVVISRIVAEAGLFYLHAYHFPCVVLVGFMGASALGPKMMVIMMLVSTVLLIDPREALLPFMMNGLRLTELNKVSPGKTATWAAVSLIVAFAVALPVTMYIQYDQGVEKAGDGWTRWLPAFAIDEVAKVRSKLDSADRLAETNKLHGWERFGAISPDFTRVTAFVIAGGLVLLFTAARLRWPGWPFHPVMFLVLATHQSRNLAASFLIGGAIKVFVTKMFGSRAYEKFKPAMFGLVAGDMLGGILTMIVGGIYYAQTGLTPKRFMILPF